MCLSDHTDDMKDTKNKKSFDFSLSFWLLSAPLALYVTFHLTNVCYSTTFSDLCITSLFVRPLHALSDVVVWAANAHRGTRCGLAAHVLSYLTPPHMSLPFSVADTILVFSVQRFAPY